MIVLLVLLIIIIIICRKMLSHQVRDHPEIITPSEKRVKKAPLFGPHDRNQVCLLRWKILVHGTVF